ncbi:hypothetical protein FE257_002324 [Aspergillus nanangensis]|uniref:Uncharacterized protein n=1 Tax=Aspergillus nanangensis TaxID=2582783 RepID=A0AAD4CCS5_ASPNN|nr:hypothetical protein FE257_002324 [Aspergillus nanangensis]
MLFKRRQYLEIEDQPWCSEWLVNYIQSYLTYLWGVSLGSTPAATVAAKVIQRQLDAGPYLFIDPCTGAGGPIFGIEKVLNNPDHKDAYNAQFIIGDYKPYAQGMRNDRPNVTYLIEPMDATNPEKVSEALEAREKPLETGQPRQRCWVFNIAFHHFDDESARRVLTHISDNADSFIIFEFLQRDFTTLLFAVITTVIPILPFIHALGQYKSSRKPLLFFGLTLAVLAFDGFVSIIRCRTPKEIRDLFPRQKLHGKSQEWVIESGRERILPLWYLHWTIGKKDSMKMKDL